MTRDDKATRSKIDFRAVRRFALWTLAVFGLNLVAQVAVLAAMFGFFNKNYLLAVLPALFALPVYVLQPWLLFLYGTRLGSVLGPALGSLFTLALSAVITVAFYGALERAGKLEGVKRRLRTFGVRRGLVTLGLALLFVTLSGVLGYTDALPQNRGIPRLAEFYVKGVTPLLRDSRYYVLSDFLDSEVVWRAQVHPRDVGRVTQALGLAPIAQRDVPAVFAQKPPLWWRPRLTGDARGYSTRGIPIDPLFWNSEGTTALAVYEPDTGLLYVWMKNSF